MRSRDIEHIRSPVFTPQSNGKVERFNRFLKYGLQAYSTTNEWRTAIADLLAHYRATSSKPGLKSPAELFLGRTIRLPFEVVRRPQKKMTTPQPTQLQDDARPHLRCRGPYRVGDMVMYRRPKVHKGQPPYSKPIEVAAVLGNWTYRLKNGSIWNARKLKRFYTETDGYTDSPSTDSSPDRPTVTRGGPPTRILPNRTTRGRPPDYFVNANF